MASVKEEKKTLVGEEIIREILAQMGIGPQALVTAFRHEEDDEDYAVQKIEENDALYPKFSQNYPTLLKKFKNQADFA